MVSVYSEPCRDAVIEARAADAVCTKTKQRWVLTATILGSSMAFIDSVKAALAKAAEYH